MPPRMTREQFEDLAVLNGAVKILQKLQYPHVAQIVLDVVDETVAELQAEQG